MTAHATSEHATHVNEKSWTRHIPTVIRTLMGLIFFASGVFGLLMALGVVPFPEGAKSMPDGAAAFMGAMVKTGYLLFLIKITETAGGALLVLNRFVPLALAILAPLLVNIVAFHLFLAPSGLAIPVVLLALEIYLARSYRDTYRPMLAMRVTLK